MSDTPLALKNKAMLIAQREAPNIPSDWTYEEIYMHMMTKTTNTDVASAAATLIRGAVDLMSEARVSDQDFWAKHDGDIRARNLEILNQDYEAKQARVAAGGYSRGHVNSDSRGDEEISGS